MAKRIDSLTAGETVNLKFHGSKSLGNGSHVCEAIFVAINGEGEERRAEFDDADGYSSSWEAYRFNGHWAYGSSAERLSVI